MPVLDRILLGHGAGGRLTRELIEKRFVPRLANPFLAGLSDSAVLDVLPSGRPALTTDAFVVDPPIFPGGDLGYLSVCGTVNDLAVVGAVPAWLTWALILEEGLEVTLLDAVVDGAARAAREAGVELVAGDTKVVPRGKGDRVFAVTAGLGVVPPGRCLGDARIRPGDVLVASGSLGDHGATILACRHGMETDLTSDCAPLAELAHAALASGAALRVMHDPTRGGVATTCCEVAARADVRIVLHEEALPVRPAVEATCELLGLDPLYLACEGRFLAWVDPRDEERLVDALRSHPLGLDAVRVGEVTARSAGAAPVVLRTRAGVFRPLDSLSGMDLPRIC